MEWLRGQAGYTLTELLVVCALFGMIAAGSLGLYKVAQETYTTSYALVDSQSEARAAIDRMVADLRLVGSFVKNATNAPDSITSASSSAITFLADIDGDTLAVGTDGVSGTADDVEAYPTAISTTVTVSSATGFCASEGAREYLFIGNGLTREVKQISSISGSVLTLSSSLTNSFSTGSSSGTIVRSVESVAWTYDSSAQTLTRQVTTWRESDSVTCSTTAQTIASNVSSFTLTYYNSSNSTTTTAADIRRIKVNLTVGSGSTKRTLEVEVHPVSLSLS